MIDVEPMVFTRVSDKVHSKFPKVSVSGEEVRSPSELPFASVVETDNYTYTNTIDSGSNENHAVVVFEVDCGSNKTSKKKSECKAIMSCIDEEMLAIGFTRTMLIPVRDEDTTVYRLKARYTAVVSSDKKFYRR